MSSISFSRHGIWSRNNVSMTNYNNGPGKNGREVSLALEKCQKNLQKFFRFFSIFFSLTSTSGTGSRFRIKWSSLGVINDCFKREGGGSPLNGCSLLILNAGWRLGSFPYGESKSILRVSMSFGSNVPIWYFSKVFSRMINSRLFYANIFGNQFYCKNFQ